MQPASQQGAGERQGSDLSAGDVAGQLLIVASGADSLSAIGAALTGVADAVNNPRLHSAESGSVSVPIRAEGAEIVALVRALAASLLDVMEESDHVIGSVRIDGILRTDEGLAGWGYALATPTARGDVPPMTVNDVTVEERGEEIIIRLTLAPARPATP